MNELEKLQKMIKESGLTPYFIHKQTDISQAALSKILHGKVKKPNVSTIQSLEKFFEDYKKQDSRNLMGMEQLAREPEKIGDNHFLTVAGTKVMIVPLIEHDAQAEFIQKHDNSSFINDLPRHALDVDKFHRGKYFAFTVAGDGMDDGTKESIINGDMVTAREIQRSLWNSRVLFNQYKNFVIVHKEGVMVKRIISHNTDEGTITCSGINPDRDKYPDIEVSLEDVKMILNIVEICRNN